MSSPSAPVEVGFLDTAGSAGGVVVSACSIFVADDWAGMAVIRDCDALFCDGYETGDTSAWSAAVGGP